MKQFGTLLMLLFSLTVSAQSDFDIAREFMSKKGVTLVNNPSKTRGVDKPYSIFNGSDDKGFCIVANGNVIGYDTENTIDEDNMPCCLKELLDVLGKVVTPSKTRGLTERVVEPIKPMIKTKWDNGSPYTDSIYYRKSICYFVAEAQILHYLRVNFYVEGHFLFSDKPIDLYPTTFDHDLIDREGEEGWAEETARFFKYARFGIDLLKYDYETKFGVHDYKEEFGEYDSRYQIYDKYLEKGMPLLVGSPNHGFIVDGRSEDGKYHVNFGWGGLCDGYYFFPDTKDDKQYINDNMEYNRDTFYWVHYFTPVKETTSTMSIKHNQNINDVYNLQGIRVGKTLKGLPKGIYVQGGKKVIK